MSVNLKEIVSMEKENIFLTRINLCADGGKMVN
jgi:hypothetical protein